MLGEIKHGCVSICGCHKPSDGKEHKLKILLLFIGSCGMCRSAM